jgi:hypothetical protein
MRLFRIISLGLLLVSMLFHRQIQEYFPQFAYVRMALRFLH